MQETGDGEAPIQQTVCKVTQLPTSAVQKCFSHCEQGQEDVSTQPALLTSAAQ